MTSETKPTPATVPPVSTSISAALTASGMTQSAMSRRLHMSRTALNDRIAGRTRYTAEELPAIAAMLGRTVAELLTPAPRPMRGYSVAPVIIDEAAAFTAEARK